MLNCLRIRDLAIIDALEIELGPGLNVLTGETGAGKSILVSALELVLGGRGRPELVRSGAKCAEVEALFELGAGVTDAVQEQLRALDVPDGEELVVRRVLQACGRTRAFINGRLATQQQLARLTRGLADISSQHEHHTLSDPSTHLGYLDAFAKLDAQRARVAEAHHALCRADVRLREFSQRWQERASREAVLREQIREIEALAPEPDEDTRLEQECARLRHSESRLRLVAEAAELIYERDDSLLDELSHAGRKLTEAALLDPELLPVAEQLEAARAQLAEAARELQRHTDGGLPEPDALQRAEERLYELSKLRRRYGGTLQAALEQLQKSRAELDELDNPTTIREALEQAHEQALQEARNEARALSSKRHGAATRLSRAISRELASLGMGEARILVDVSPLEAGSASNGRELALDGARFTERGIDRVEFLIAPNRGEDARSLHRVASGGELSRSMLAIKCALADLGPAGLYVFDEVDSGLGGGMAEIVGRKIRSVAHHRQVLCITHLPQIAVFADQHFKVEKKVEKAADGDRTLSSVRRLTAREQREEIARMLGGLQITPRTRAAAREMLSQARSRAA